MAERAGAYWLLDEIALIRPCDKRVAAEAFQVWKLKANADRSRGQSKTPKTDGI